MVSKRSWMTRLCLAAWVCGGVLFGGLATGCSLFSTAPAAKATGRPTIPTPASSSSTKTDIDPAVQRSTEQAQRLSEALQKLHHDTAAATPPDSPPAASAPTSASGVPEVRWIEPSRPPGSAVTVTDVPAPAAPLAAAAPGAGETAPSAAVTPAPPPTGESPVAHAASVVGAAPANSPDAAPAQAGASAAPPAGPPPVKIANLQLCKWVRSFGVYEPFPNTTFLAGRAQRAIVYVEVAHFKTQVDGAPAPGSGDADGPTAPSTGTGYVVKLQQEVAILNQADGLEVWHAAPAQIVDQARAQRRDFFVVQMITLPANLGVGKYQLKVRLTDTQAGTMDETLLPFSMVADQALASGINPAIPTPGAAR